jgi:hypothetical protein
VGAGQQIASVRVEQVDAFDVDGDLDRTADRDGSATVGDCGEYRALVIGEDLGLFDIGSRAWRLEWTNPELWRHLG